MVNIDKQEILKRMSILAYQKQKLSNSLCK